MRPTRKGGTAFGVDSPAISRARHHRAGATGTADRQASALTRRRLATRTPLATPAALAGSAILAAACAACAGPGASGAPGSGASGATGSGGGGAAQRPALRPDVTVAFLQPSGQVEQTLVAQVGERWKQAHPAGPQAELIVSPGGVVEEFSARAAAGAPPALGSMDASPGLPVVDRGDVSPLADFIKRDRDDLADAIPAALDQYRWKGKLYALLRDFSHQGLWINTDLVQTEGVPRPTGDDASAAGGGDFDAFLAAARRLTEPGPTPTRAAQHGSFLTTGRRGGYGRLGWANGAELFDEGFETCTAGAARVGGALQVLQALLHRHRVAPAAAAPAELKAAGVQTGAQQQRFDDTVALAFLPVARIGEARRSATGRWDLVVAPQGKGAHGRRLTSGGGAGWSLVRASPYQEEGWAPLAHFTSPEAHTLLADVRIPGRKSVLEWWLAQAPNDPPASRGVARTGQEHVHVNPSSRSGTASTARCSGPSSPASGSTRPPRATSPATSSPRPTAPSPSRPRSHVAGLGAVIVRRPASEPRASPAAPAGPRSGWSRWSCRCWPGAPHGADHRDRGQRAARTTRTTPPAVRR